jgi:hypothetical protein
VKGSLATELPNEINRVRMMQEEFKSLLWMPKVMVEPQIAMMERDIQAGIASASSGNLLDMLRAFEALKGWQE